MLIILIDFVAISMLGPVTMYIWPLSVPLSVVHIQAIILNINSVTPNLVAFLTQRCLSLKIASVDIKASYNNFS